MLDITEAKAAGAAVEESEALLRSILDPNAVPRYLAFAKDLVCGVYPLKRLDLAQLRASSAPDAASAEAASYLYSSSISLTDDNQPQEGFLKAWRSIHRFKGQSSFYTWLYRIMTNVTIDALRRKGVHGEAEFDDRIAPARVDPGSRTTPSSAPLPHQKLEQNEIRRRINEAIARLSPEHRAVIVMKEMEDLQYNEIAEVLDCSIGTVMSSLFYARKKLQTFLRDVYENL